MGAELPRGWQFRTVGEIAADTPRGIAIGPFGSRMKADCYVSRGVPVIRGNNISDTKTLVGEFVFISEEKADELASCNVYDGDLVFPHRGLIGEVGLLTGTNERYVLSTSLMRLTPNRRIASPAFLFYFFRSPSGRHELLKNASQVGTPGIATPLTSLRSIRVPVPPIAEQESIARFLGALDDKIDLNRRTNETLESIARATFKSWFVDFDPVRAKAEGRQPAGMDAETAALFPTRMKPSPIGPVPTNWHVRPLPQVISVNPPRSISTGTSAPYLDMQNAPTRGHRPDYWTVRLFGSGVKFQNGDTLLARITPCLENGKTAYVDFLSEGQIGWGSTEYIVLRSIPPLPLEYSYYLARDEDFRAFAIQNMTGTSGRQRVPSSCFDQYLMVVSGSAVAERFGTIARSFMPKISANSEQNQTLASIRDALLPKLLSGELRIRDAEKMVEAHV
jgi:type I restriction enzyme S subunit